MVRYHPVESYRYHPESIPMRLKSWDRIKSFLVKASKMLTISILKKRYTPPKTNEWQWKIPPMNEDVSPTKKWWFSIVMSFSGEYSQNVHKIIIDTT